MRYKNILNTNINLSLIGLGTVKFGRNTDVKYPENFQLPSKDNIIKLLNLAKELGINTLDTAPAYGASEAILGSIFANKNNNIIRSDWHIITKAGENYYNNQSEYNFNSDFINTSINTSLEKLNTKYLDILLIHSDGSDLEIANNDKLWNTLEYRKSLGDIKAYGVSSKAINNDITGALECLKRSDLAMVTYRQDYLIEKPLLDFAQNNNKAILLKKVLNSGYIKTQEDITAALKFSSNHPAVASMILGTLNPAHLEQNAKNLNYD